MMENRIEASHRDRGLLNYFCGGMTVPRKQISIDLWDILILRVNLVPMDSPITSWPLVWKVLGPGFVFAAPMESRRDATVPSNALEAAGCLEWHLEKYGMKPIWNLRIPSLGLGPLDSDGLLAYMCSGLHKWPFVSLREIHESHSARWEVAPELVESPDGCQKLMSKLIEPIANFFRDAALAQLAVYSDFEMVESSEKPSGALRLPFNLLP